MIIGLPRTGSSWLGSVINLNTDFNYFREYFNPWTWEKHNFQEGCKDLVLDPNLAINNMKYLNLAFGKESPSFNLEEKNKLIARPWEENKELLNVFKQTWTFDKKHKIVDKEVWSFCNIGFFHKYFNIILLHRKADLIFWGNPENNLHTYKFYSSIYNSFVFNADFYDSKTRRLIVKKSDLREQCRLGHKLASHIIFREAEKYGLPIIDYEALISCDNPLSIEKYLKNKLPNELLTIELIEGILNSKFEKDFIDTRKAQTSIFVKKIKLI